MTLDGLIISAGSALLLYWALGILLLLVAWIARKAYFWYKWRRAKRRVRDLTRTLAETGTIRMRRGDGAYEYLELISK